MMMLLKKGKSKGLIQGMSYNILWKTEYTFRLGYATRIKNK